MQLTAERFDVVVIERIFRQTIKGSIQAADSCGIRFLIKLGGLSGKFYFKTYGGNTEAGRVAYKKQIVEDLGFGLALKPHIVGQAALRSERFISWRKTNYLDHNQEREWPAVKKVHVHLSQEAVIDCLEKLLGEKLVNTSGTDRHIMMSMPYKYVGLKNHEIGELCNCDYSTVSQARKRLLVQAGKDERLKRRIDDIESILSKIKI